MGSKERSKLLSASRWYVKFIKSLKDCHEIKKILTTKMKREKVTLVHKLTMNEIRLCLWFEDIIS